MGRVLRRWKALWSGRAVSALVPLVSCVIILQTLILINMTHDKAVQTYAQYDVAKDNDASKDNDAGRDSSTNHTSTAPPSVFDFEKCSCGLHFKVDASEALVLPNSANNDHKRFLTIGIPTVRRRDGTYIIKTVTSLLSNMDAVEQNEVVIVVMVADFDPKDRNLTIQELNTNFHDAINAGNIQIISPPLDLYSTFKVTKQTYSQDINYVKWRSKQNFDYAYLMRYSASLSLYYMQLEDDVTSAKNFINLIQRYIDEQKSPWTCLEFSELGYIGKLYRSKDVVKLSQLLLMFFQEQPVDYTYLYFNMLMTQMQKRLRTPTLFQHQGVHSSLPGKVQPLKDRFFDNLSKVHHGHNPPAQIYTTMSTYLNFVPTFPYAQEEGYFWTHGSPAAGDTFIIVFETPQTLERVIVETGSESHPDDKLLHGRLKVSLTHVNNSERLECTNDINLGEFKDGNIEVKDVSETVKFKVMCVQIEVLKAQTSWLIIREIAVFVQKAS